MKLNQAVQLRDRFSYLNGTVSEPENGKIWRVVIGPTDAHALDEFLFQLRSTDSRDVDLLPLFAGDEVDVYVVFRNMGDLLPVKADDYGKKHGLATDNPQAS